MKENIYLDTSVPSAYYDGRVKERQKETIKFMNVVLPNYNVYTSNITIEELKNTKENNLKNKLLKLIKPFKILKSNSRIDKLASSYVKHEIISEKNIYDALHAAITAYYNISYLISWNFEHLVKVKTRKMLNSVNILEGFNNIEIISPLEL